MSEVVRPLETEARVLPAFDIAFSSLVLVRHMLGSEVTGTLTRLLPNIVNTESIASFVNNCVPAGTTATQWGNRAIRVKRLTSLLTLALAEVGQGAPVDSVSSQALHSSIDASRVSAATALLTHLNDMGDSLAPLIPRPARSREKQIDARLFAISCIANNLPQNLTLIKGGAWPVAVRLMRDTLFTLPDDVVIGSEMNPQTAAQYNHAQLTDTGAALWGLIQNAHGIYRQALDKSTGNA